MTAKALHIATEQPGSLEISRLEALLERHPYFTAAWVKLLLEYRALGKEDKVRDLLSKVAAMAPDRSILKKRLEATVLLETEGKSTQELPATEETQAIREKEEEKEETPAEEVPHPDEVVETEEIENAVAAEEKTETKAEEAHSFTEWLHYLQHHPAAEETGAEEKPEEEERIIDAGAMHEARYQMEAASLEEKEEARAGEDEDDALSEADLDQAKEMAARSLTMDESLITETLAKVYLIQGKNDKAIEIYQRLILKIPERSSYFEAQIKKLKGS